MDAASALLKQQHGFVVALQAGDDCALLTSEVGGANGAQRFPLLLKCFYKRDFARGDPCPCAREDVDKDDREDRDRILIALRGNRPSCDLGEYSSDSLIAIDQLSIARVTASCAVW